MLPEILAEYVVLKFVELVIVDAIVFFITYLPTPCFLMQACLEPRLSRSTC